MGLLDIFGKKEENRPEGVPFALDTRFRPIRLKALGESKTELLIDLQNISGEDALVSVVVKLPDKIGTDSIGLHRAKELRVGQIGVNEKKNLSVDIYGSSKTTAGNYEVEITAFSHYRDYSHVLNSVRKKVMLRAV